MNRNQGSGMGQISDPWFRFIALSTTVVYQASTKYDVRERPQAALHDPQLTCCRPMTSTCKNRPLTASEYALAKWMLENGLPEARVFLQQLDRAQVTPWKCPCGCASIHFQIDGHPPASLVVHVIGDFVCGAEDSPAGAFIFESDD